MPIAEDVLTTRGLQGFHTMWMAGVRPLLTLDICMSVDDALRKDDALTAKFGYWERLRSAPRRLGPTREQISPMLTGNMKQETRMKQSHVQGRRVSEDIVVALTRAGAAYLETDRPTPGDICAQRQLHLGPGAQRHVGGGVRLEEHCGPAVRFQSSAWSSFLRHCSCAQLQPADPELQSKFLRI